MHTIPSSFLPTNPHLLNASSFGVIINTPKSPLIIKAKASSLTFINHHQRKKQSSLLAIILNTLDDFTCNFLDLPLRPSVDPKQVLSGFFSPVDELPPTACKVVEGTLPSCLDGVYMRNGPNPQFTPKGPYHFLDGDGMLHMIKISNSKATFCSRYVSTHKHTVEREMGYAFVPSIFASFNGVAATISRSLLTVARVLTGQFDPLKHGFGAANTSLALFAGHIFALCESDLPYAVKVTPDGDITTIGRHDFQASDRKFMRMTAHPKPDRLTGEVFAYGYGSTPPYLTFFRIDSNGRKQKDVPIFSMEGPTALHDFAVTQNYAVFPDIQVVVNTWLVFKGKSPVEIDPSKIPRVGVIGRYAESEKEMVWVDAPGLNPFHVINAWEEDGGDKIVIIATNAKAVDQFLEEIGDSELTMEKIVINVKEKSVKRRSLSHTSLEFGVINPAYAGNTNRYVYATVIDTKRTLGIVKLDLSLMKDDDDERDCTVASRLHGPGSCIAEPFFVAREPDNAAADEDDGYLVSYFYDGNDEESKFLVMDAKSPTLDIIAAVKLPQRVPDGFHGLFVSQSELNKLRN